MSFLKLYLIFCVYVHVGEELEYIAVSQRSLGHRKYENKKKKEGREL